MLCAHSFGVQPLMSVCFFKRDRKGEDKQQVLRQISNGTSERFFFFVIHCVDITRQIQSVNIYAVQYINHTWKGNESHPVCLFFLGFCSFKSKELLGV